MTYKIMEMSWTEYEHRKKETDTVIVPTGAVEVYGPHLPMGADCVAAEAISRFVAERTGALIAPLIKLGESTGLIGLPGTLTLSKETFHQVIDGLFTELIRHGFKNPYTKALLDAVPVPDPAGKRKRDLLKGEITSPIDPPPGCRFAKRCFYASDGCFSSDPELKEYRPEHFVACHNAGEVNGLTAERQPSGEREVF